MCAVNRLLCSLPGRMFIFYGNKTSTQFLNFTPTLICSDDLQANILGPVATWATGRVGGRMDWEDAPGAGPAALGSLTALRLRVHNPENCLQARSSLPSLEKFPGRARAGAPGPTAAADSPGGQQGWM